MGERSKKGLLRNANNMTIKNKIIIIVLAILLIAFLFPKRNGTWMVSREADYYCKCWGYEHISGEPIQYQYQVGWMAEEPGNSLCIGIPYSCGDAGLDNYLGK